MRAIKIYKCLQDFQTNIQIEGEEVHIDIVMVKNAINQFKNRKSPEPEEINTELLKYETMNLF